jgi:hypothetical protein
VQRRLEGGGCCLALGAFEGLPQHRLQPVDGSGPSPSRTPVSKTGMISPRTLHSPRTDDGELGRSVMLVAASTSRATSIGTA